MNQIELKKKLQQRNPIFTNREIVKPVDFYANPQKAEDLEEQEKSAISHNRTNAQSHNRTSAIKQPERKNRGYKLREDLIKACKTIANEEDKHLYEVMEEALSNYIAMKNKKP